MLLYGYVFKHYFSLRATSPFAGFARSHARTAREKGLKSLRKSLKPVSKKLITLKKIRCGAKPTWSVQTTSFIFKKEIATKQNKITRIRHKISTQHHSFCHQLSLEIWGCALFSYRNPSTKLTVSQIVLSFCW